MKLTHRCVKDLEDIKVHKGVRRPRRCLVRGNRTLIRAICCIQQRCWTDINACRGGF